MSTIDHQRIETARRRVRDHEGKVQQLQGRRQSLQEQRDRYASDLQAAGLTAEELPNLITQSEAAAQAALTELEQVLDSVGA